MRVLRSVPGLAAALLLIALASPAAAQTTGTSTTTTVRSLPITGATTTTAAGATADPDLADTGIAADLLVPAGFSLIAVGALLEASSRRRTRHDFGLL